MYIYILGKYLIKNDRWQHNYKQTWFFFVFITTNKCTIIYHNRIALYNIYYYVYRHFCVIVREFYICALLSYINS